MNLSYGRSTMCVGVLACWNLAFRRYSRHPGTPAGYPALLNPLISLFGYFFVGLAVGGMVFCLFYRNRAVGLRRRSWYGIEGTTADFVYLYALAISAGLLLHIASLR